MVVRPPEVRSTLPSLLRTVRVVGRTELPSWRLVTTLPDVAVLLPTWRVLADGDVRTALVLALRAWLDNELPRRFELYRPACIPGL